MPSAFDLQYTKDKENGGINEDDDYYLNHKHALTTFVSEAPRACVHSMEWKKIMEGDPVEINPSLGHGLKVMTVDEWAARWKRNEDYPDCLACGSLNTKEHHFMQAWCRARKKFESEVLCLDCYMFSWRSYCDPDFQTPEDTQKTIWEAMMKEQTERMQVEGPRNNTLETYK